MDRQLNSLDILAEVCRQIAAAEEGAQGEEAVSTTTTSIATATLSNQLATVSNPSSLPEFTNNARMVLCRWLEENGNNLNPDLDTMRDLASLTSITYYQV